MAAVTDSFDRTDSSTTMGNADSGQTWVPNAGVWGISSNGAYRVSGSEATTVVDSSLAGCTITVTMLQVGLDSGLCYRSTDNSNYFVLTHTDGGVYKKEAGAWTLMGTPGGAFANGDTMSVVLSGDSHTVKKNGSTVTTFSSSFNQTATKHGLWSGGAGDWFNNFSIIPLVVRAGMVITQAVRRAATR